MGIVEAYSGRLVERYEYTPYGERKVYAHGWLYEDVTGDAVVNPSDLAAITQDWLGTGWSQGDINGDGLVNPTDLGLNTTAWLTSIDYSAADPWVSYPRLRSVRGAAVLSGELVVHHNLSLCDFGHQGLMHDENTGLIYNRARMRDPKLGRFMQRDPLGYVDGIGLYATYHLMHGGVDPSGATVSYLTPERAKKLYKFHEMFADEYVLNAEWIEGPGAQIHWIESAFTVRHESVRFRFPFKDLYINLNVSGVASVKGKVKCCFRAPSIKDSAYQWEGDVDIYLIVEQPYTIYVNPPVYVIPFAGVTKSAKALKYSFGGLQGVKWSRNFYDLASKSIDINKKFQEVAPKLACAAAMMRQVGYKTPTLYIHATMPRYTYYDTAKMLFLK